MRSIGKVKIKKLKVIVAEEIAKMDKYPGYIAWIQVQDNIKARIPEFWYDTWEMAYSEIERLINDEVMNYQYKRS